MDASPNAGAGFAKRTKILVDKKFQLQYLYTWLITAVAMILLAGAFYYAMTRLISQDVNPIISKMMMGMAAFILLYTIFMGIMTVMMTHRVAGATYRLEKHIKQVMAGDYAATIHLRKNDYQIRFGEYLNTMTVNLKKREENLRQAASDLDALRSRLQLNGRLGPDEERLLQSAKDKLAPITAAVELLV